MHRLAIALGVLLLTGGARADDTSPAELPGESRAAAGRLADARKLADAGKWADARAIYQALIDAKGSDLVPLDDGRLVPARRLAHAAMARLPAKELEAYRDKVEPQAKRWLQEAERDDDPALLARIVEEAFASRQSVAAADRLGDRAFLRGRFDEAENWWRLIAPVDEVKNAPADLLIYPAPKDDIAARLRAKQVLARLFRGDAIDAELAAFRKRHPKAAGRLAGRTGAYADTLAAVAAARRKRIAAPSDDWPTFAGDDSRSRSAVGTAPVLDQLSQLARGGPTWRFDLGARKRVTGAIAAGAVDVNAARRVAFHPVLVGDLALVADARYVTAYDLRTGAVSEWYDAAKEVGGLKPTLTLPAPADLRYTLSVAEGCVFARLGAQAISDIRPRDGEAPADAESLLVCLSLRPGADGERKRWMVRAVDPGRKEHAVFEGAPVVSHGRVFVAATRFEGTRVVTAIHCYASQPEDTAPPLLWRVDVCSTRELLPAGAEAGDALKRRMRHHLLTLAGGNVVYCSHSGAVVALDARTGARRWAIRYPRRAAPEAEDDPIYRDLAPPLLAGGRLYVAPADSDRMLCLSPDAGEVIWQRDGLDAVHLLGVGQGRLIFSTYRGPTLGQLNAGGLRAVRAADGSDEDGWSLPDDGGGLLPFGRGLLVNDLVLWPTAQRPFGVFAINQTDGLQPDNPALLHRVPSGSLLYSGGRLLVSDTRYLHAFIPPERLPDEPDAKTAADALRQGRAAAARGETERALERLDVARRDGLSRTKREAARERERALLDAARRAIVARQAESAERWLAMTAPSAEGLARVAGWWEEAGEKARARGRWEEIAIRHAGATLDAGGPRPRRAGRVAVARLGTDDPGMMRRWRQAPPEARARALADLVRWWPGSAVTRAALAEEARRAEKGAAAEAARHWARLVAIREDPDAVAGLALAWDRLGCPAAAKVARGRLPPGHAGRKEGGARAAPAVVGRFLPLGAKADVTLAPREEVLFLAGAEGPVRERLFSGAPGELICRDRTSGDVLWRRRVPMTPRWGGAPGTIVLAGGESGIVALDSATGEELWRYDAPGQGPLSDAAPAPLTGWHLGGDALLVVQGGRRLLCLDALTGDVRWARHAPGALPGRPGGAFRRVDLASGRAVAVSSKLEYLDLRSGKALFTAAASPEAPRPPAFVGEHVLVVPSADEVVCLARADGARRWSFRPEGHTTRSGEPPLVVAANDSALVVVSLNIGNLVHRLDARTGKPLWRQPVLVAGNPPAEGAWLAHKEALYHADAEGLSARALSDGKSLWRRELSGASRWRLAVQAGALLAWPEALPGARFSFRHPGGTLQWQLGPLRDDRASVLCVRPKDGEIVQRITFRNAPRRPWRAATPAASLMPLLGVRAEPDVPTGLRVAADDRGLIVAFANRARCFATPRSSK